MPRASVFAPKINACSLTSPDNPITRFLPRVWHVRIGVVHVFDGALRLSGELVQIADCVARWRDWVTHYEHQFMRLDVIGVHGQRFECADDRHWYHRDLRLD